MSQHLLPTTIPCLRNNRIELRCIEDRDASALLEVYGDPLVMRYTDEEPFANLQTVGLMLCSVRSLLAEGKSLEWAIVIKGNDTPIGTCGLHHFDTPLHIAEIGCLLKRSAWGVGYMIEAIDLMTIYARNVIGLCKLVADVHPDNRPAQRLFEKLGFQRDSLELWSLDLSIKR